MGSETWENLYPSVRSSWSGVCAVLLPDGKWHRVADSPAGTGYAFVKDRGEFAFMDRETCLVVRGPESSVLATRSVPVREDLTALPVRVLYLVDDDS
jgi:hypothetical protein